MLLTDQQWESLGSVPTKVLAQRILRVFEAAHHAQPAGVENLQLSEITRQLDMARGYGLVSDQDLGVYVTAAYLLGADFDTRFPEVKAVLTSAMTARDKTIWLQDWNLALFTMLGE